MVPVEATPSGRGLVVVTATVGRRHWGWGMWMMSQWMIWRDILIRCSTYQDQCLIWHSSCTPDSADIPSLCHCVTDDLVIVPFCITCLRNNELLRRAVDKDKARGGACVVHTISRTSRAR